VEFYAAVLDLEPRPDLPRPNGVWDLGSAEAAEMAKLAETTYRDVNIAFANELAMAADRLGIDLYPVIEACNSQPFSHIHRPGVAVGGHCIPVYPYLYLQTDPTAQLPRASRSVNESMPAYALGLLEATMGPLRHRRIAILGLAYRAGVKETFASGALELAKQLMARGARPAVHDPLYTDDELNDLGLKPYRRGDPCDAAVLQAAHVDYLDWGPADLGGTAAIVDGRAALDPSRWGAISYLRIGAAGTSSP
jgi:nucleotide sugar dehydrogenase